MTAPDPMELGLAPLIAERPWPWAELLDVATLRARGKTAHYFGLGFIQIKLDATWRLHVWVPEWPTIPGAESELHDHRYDFDSQVLCGALRHDLYAAGPTHAHAQPGDAERLDVTCQPGQAHDPVPLGHVRPIPIGTFTVPAGGHYRLTASAFHRSTPLGPTVTLVRRGPVQKELATVLRPPGAAFTCPFSLSPDETACWAKVAEVFQAAQVASAPRTAE
jgi:hypothetical protein